MKIIQKIAKKETFVHFTYTWKVSQILEEGLNCSEDGMMGKGVYCCKANDKVALANILKFMKEEISWDRVAKELGYESASDMPDEYVELNKFIQKISFEYTGDYLEAVGKELDYDVTGYILISVDNIEKEKLTLISNLI